jgi:hypothetical protein
MSRNSQWSPIHRKQLVVIAGAVAALIVVYYKEDFRMRTAYVALLSVALFVSFSSSALSQETSAITPPKDTGIQSDDNTLSRRIELQAASLEEYNRILNLSDGRGQLGNDGAASLCKVANWP